MHCHLYMHWSQYICTQSNTYSMSHPRHCGLVITVVIVKLPWALLLDVSNLGVARVLDEVVV